MSQLETLKNDIKDSMKNGQKDITLTLRSIMAVAQGLAKVKNVEVTDQHVIDAATKCKKEAEESMEIYRAFDTPVANENFARANRLFNLSETYLPMQMDEGIIEASIDTIISNLGATSMKDMGKVMGKFNSLHQKGTFDGKFVSQKVREKLT